MIILQENVNKGYEIDYVNTVVYLVIGWKTPVHSIVVFVNFSRSM